MFDLILKKTYTKIMVIISSDSQNMRKVRYK